MSRAEARQFQGAAENRLGDILLRAGALDQDTLTRALAAQRRSGARLGEILRAHGVVDEYALAQALGEQAGLRFVDLDRDPPNPELSDARHIALYLRLGILPWRKGPTRIIYAVEDPGAAEAALRAIGAPPPRRAGAHRLARGD